MKKNYIFALVLLLIFSCTNRSPTENNLTSTTEPDTSIIRYIDSEITDSLDKQISTPKSELSPIEIVSSTIRKGDIVNTLVITFRNVSDKTIDAVEFSWEEVDSFGAPIGEDAYDLDGKPYINNYNKGIEDIVLTPTKTGKTSIQILTKGIKKVKNVKVGKVAYANGEIWRAAGYIF